MTVRLRPAQLSEGKLQSDPFAHLLLAAFEARFAGSLVIWSGQDPFAEHAQPVRMRLEDGVVVAADFGPRHTPGLLSALIPMTVRRVGGYRFLSGIDAVGAAAHVLRGHVDPFMLLASALRGPAREDAIEQVVHGGEGRQLHLRPDCPLNRYGFTRPEWALVQDLRRRPVTLAGLLESAHAAPALVKRLIYLLRVTGAVSLLPAHRQVPSRPLSVPEPQWAQSPPCRTAPPTDLEAQAALVAASARSTAPPVPAPQSPQAPPRNPTAVVPVPVAEDTPMAPPARSQTMPIAGRAPVRAKTRKTSIPTTPPAHLTESEAARYREIVLHYQRQREQNLFQLLGVGPDAGVAAIHRAHRERAATWTRRPLPDAIGILRPLVHTLLEGLAEARDTLTDPSRRVAYVEQLRRGEGRLPSLSRLEASERDEDRARRRHVS